MAESWCFTSLLILTFLVSDVDALGPEVLDRHLLLLLISRFVFGEPWSNDDRFERIEIVKEARKPFKALEVRVKALTDLTTKLVELRHHLVVVLLYLIWNGIGSLLVLFDGQAQEIFG